MKLGQFVLCPIILSGKHRGAVFIIVNVGIGLNNPTSKLTAAGKNIYYFCCMASKPANPARHFKEKQCPGKK
jgi:hypothetical protein